MNKTKPENYVSKKKLICDWTDKKKYLVHYRMLKFYLRHEMIVIHLNFVKLIHLNRVDGWKKIYVLILKNGIRPKTNLKKLSLN